MRLDWIRAAATDGLVHLTHSHLAEDYHSTTTEIAEARQCFREILECCERLEAGRTATLADRRPK